MDDGHYNSALISLIQVASLYHVALDSKAIYHQFSVNGVFDHRSLMRALKAQNFIAKQSETSSMKINRQALPAIVCSAQDYFVLVAINHDQEYLVILPNSSELQRLSLAEFSLIFNDKIIYLKLVNSASISKTFNIKWFIPAIWKYKHVFRDVLIASFFLQLFAW